MLLMNAVHYNLMSLVCSIYIFLNNTCKLHPYWSWVQSAVTGEIWLDTVMCCIWPKFLTHVCSLCKWTGTLWHGLSCWWLARVALQPCPEVSTRRKRCSAGEATGCRWRAASLCVLCSWKCSVVLGATAREEVVGSTAENGSPLEIGGNSGHLSLPGLMAGIAWAFCMQLLILWNGGFLFTGPCRNQVSAVPVNIVREQNHAFHCCGSHTKLTSSPGFSSVFCKADHCICSSLLVIVHQLN